MLRFRVQPRDIFRESLADFRFVDVGQVLLHPVVRQLVCPHGTEEIRRQSLQDQDAVGVAVADGVVEERQGLAVEDEEPELAFAVAVGFLLQFIFRAEFELDRVVRPELVFVGQLLPQRDHDLLRLGLAEDRLLRTFPAEHPAVPDVLRELVERHLAAGTCRQLGAVVAEEDIIAEDHAGGLAAVAVRTFMERRFQARPRAVVLAVAREPLLEPFPADVADREQGLRVLVETLLAAEVLVVRTQERRVRRDFLAAPVAHHDVPSRAGIAAQRERDEEHQYDRERFLQHGDCSGVVVVVGQRVSENIARHERFVKGISEKWTVRSVPRRASRRAARENRGFSSAFT